MSILEKTFKKTTLSDFIKIAGKHPNLKDFFIEFLKKNAPEKLDEYMELLKSPEEMFFFALEQYFQSTKFTDRKKYIKLARENQKLIDNSRATGTGDRPFGRDRERPPYQPFGCWGLHYRTRLCSFGYSDQSGAHFRPLLQHCRCADRTRSQFF